MRPCHLVSRSPAVLAVPPPLAQFARRRPSSKTASRRRCRRLRSRRSSMGRSTEPAARAPIEPRRLNTPATASRRCLA